MFFKSKKLVALDIGTSSIKMAELDVGRKGISLVNYGQWPTPPSSIQSGEIVDMDSLSVAIKTLIQESRCKRVNTCAGMWGTTVIVKRISIPRIESEMIADQVKWEAEQYIPFDANEICLAYHVLESGSNDSETMDILLVAAKQDLVFQYAELISLAGLTPSIVDVSGFALANCFEVNYGKMAETVAILNLGAGVSNFVVVENGNVAFSRDIPVGGQTFTNEIHKELGVSVQEAEALKLNASSQMDVPNEVHSIIASTNETVAEEIQNSFEFFSATSGGAAIQRVYISGGSAVIPNLANQISTAVSVPFETLDPFAGLDVKLSPKSFPDIEALKPFAGVVVGLGIRQLGDVK